MSSAGNRSPEIDSRTKNPRDDSSQSGRNMSEKQLRTRDNRHNTVPSAKHREADIHLNTPDQQLPSISRAIVSRLGRQEAYYDMTG